MRNGTIVTLELFGTPRVVAGARRIQTTGSDLSDVLNQAVNEAPMLGNHILDPSGSWLNAGYIFVVDGNFTDDPNHAVSPDSDVLLVARASGG